LDQKKITIIPFNPKNFPVQKKLQLKNPGKNFQAQECSGTNKSRRKKIPFKKFQR